MKACLMAAGVYIVLQGLWLLVLLSRTRVPNAPLIIVRFFVGALICFGSGDGLIGPPSRRNAGARGKGRNEKTKQLSTALKPYVSFVVAGYSASSRNARNQRYQRVSTNGPSGRHGREGTKLILGHLWRVPGWPTNWTFARFPRGSFL